jgi:hypothetical protein
MEGTPIMVSVSGGLDGTCPGWVSEALREIPVFGCFKLFLGYKSKIRVLLQGAAKEP